MKTLANILSLSLFLVFASFSNAQNIPNGSFDNWDNNGELSASDFNSVGLVSRTTDKKVGSSAIKLENKNRQGARNLIGAISNTAFDSGFAYGGIPYDERPLSLKFWAKYDLAKDDKAHIICYFKSDARVMGIINFQIEGSSNNQFLEYSVPITWYNVGLPDTVTFFASSTSLYNGYARDDGYIILDDLHFATINNRNGSLANGDFENWDTTEVITPQSWFRTEDFLIEQEGEDFGIEWVKKIDDGQSGSAVLMQNRKVGNDIAAGALLSHSDYVNFLKPSFPISHLWKYIEGYYKFDSDNGDSAQCTVAVYNSGTLVGGVDFRIGTEASEWTYFAMPMAYFWTSGDSATILIASSDPDNPMGENTKLWMDQLRFADWTISVDEPTVPQVYIYPNPASDFVQVSLPVNGHTTISIKDMNGRTVLEQNAEQSENQINIAQLQAGVYFLSISTENYTTTKKFIKNE